MNPYSTVKIASDRSTASAYVKEPRVMIRRFPDCKGPDTGVSM